MKDMLLRLALVCVVLGLITGFTYGMSLFVSSALLHALIVAVFATIIAYLAAKYFVSIQAKLVNQYAKEVISGSVSAKPDPRISTSNMALVESIDTLDKNVKKIIGKMLTTTEKLTDLIEKLKNSSEIIAESSENVATNITEIAQSIDHISTESETTMGSAEKMVNDIQSFSQVSQEGLVLTGRMKDNLDKNVHNTSALIQSTQDTSSSNQVISDKIRLLNEDMKKIESIVEIINGITEQTNLLALNASIEAARAGESGKGFAVVAEEVRKLAEESAVSTGEIKTIISSLSEVSSQVTKLIKDGSKIIENSLSLATISTDSNQEITDDVKETMTSMDNISTLCSHQQETTEDVFKLIGAIADQAKNVTANSEEAAALTEEQAASIDDVSQSVETLHDTASELETIVNEYKATLKMDEATKQRIKQSVEMIKSHVGSTSLSSIYDFNRQRLEAFASRYKEIEFVAVADVAGEAFAFSRDIGVQTINIGYRQYFKGAMKDQVYVSEPYISMLTDEYCVTISMPFLIEGVKEGIFITDVTIK